MMVKEDPLDRPELQCRRSSFDRIHLMVKKEELVADRERGSTRLERTPMSWIVLRKDPLDCKEILCRGSSLERIHLTVENKETTG